jgi:hypothetical protein
MQKIVLYASLLAIMACTSQNKDKSKDITTQPNTIEEIATEADYQVQLVLHDSITSEEKAELINKVKTTSKRLFHEFNLNEEEVFKIHLWKHYEEFLDFQESLMGQRIEGSSGYVFGPTDLAVYYNDGMVENVEHEFVHGASLHLNENFGNNPRWFWESVAIYESDEFIHPKELDYLVEGEFPKLDELNGMLSATGANKVYQVGYLLSEFIIENWSREKYLELIKVSGNLNQVFGLNEAEFMVQWEDFVQEKYLN